MNPASCMHNSHDSWAREGKNMFVMTLFLHTIPRFPFPHAPGFVNWRDYALNTGSYPGWSFRKCIEISGRQVPQGFFLSFNAYLSNLLNFKWYLYLLVQTKSSWVVFALLKIGLRQRRYTIGVFTPRQQLLLPDLCCKLGVENSKFRLLTRF